MSEQLLDQRGSGSLRNPSTSIQHPNEGPTQAQGLIIDPHSLSCTLFAPRAWIFSCSTNHFSQLFRLTFTYFLAISQSTQKKDTICPIKVLNQFFFSCFKMQVDQCKMWETEVKVRVLQRGLNYFVLARPAKKLGRNRACLILATRERNGFAHFFAILSNAAATTFGAYSTNTSSFAHEKLSLTEEKTQN